MRVAVFGGSFDPPHSAHQQAVRLLTRLPEVDRVLVVPVFEHAFDKSLAPFEHRVRMCEISMLENDRVSVSPIEASLARPSYTLHTLRALHEQHPDYSLRLVVGADVLQDATKWHRFDEVCRLAPLLPLGRKGVKSRLAPQAVLPEVSSTEIRELLRGRASSSVPPKVRGRLLELVPPEVLAYIEAHDLYR
jgi:nicotinate-nucleotide adenylyltransferase